MGFIPAASFVFVINFQETQKRLSIFGVRVMALTKVTRSSTIQSCQLCDMKLATLVTPASAVSSNNSQPCQQQLWMIYDLFTNNDLFKYYN